MQDKDKIIQGIVKSIYPNAQQQEYELQGKVYKKYTVTFIDSKQYNFSEQKNFNNGDLAFKVGDAIAYKVTNEKYKSAQYVYIPKENTSSKTNTSPKTPRTQQQEIQLSVCFNGAVRLASKGKIKLDEVPLFTKDFYNSIFN